MTVTTVLPGNRRSKKIEMVLPALKKAGMEIMTARLSRGLTELGYEIGFTCFEAGDALADELREEGYRVTIVPTPGLLSLVHAPQLTSWLRGLRPDVVHVHSGVWMKTAPAARRAGVRRVVHTYHGLFERDPWYLPTLTRWAAHFTDDIVAVAEPIRTYLTELGGVDPKKVSLIPNGIDTEVFQPGTATGALRAPLSITRDRLVVGNVARLAPVKNQELLAEAFALVRAQVPDAALVVVGEGELRERLQSRIASLGLDAHAHLVGEVRDTTTAYRDFDLFVLSSNVEGTSMSMLEAMASGVCVVATAVGGNPDLLGHGRYGVLVPPGNPAALANAMSALLRDPRRRRELAAAARKHVVTHYSHAAMIAAYEELYRDRSAGECAA